MCKMCKTRSKNHSIEAGLYIIASLLLLSAISLDVLGADMSDTNSLFDLSLEQLMDVGVYAAATLTEKNPLKTPASVTVITARDIALTPARNILDLIEIYVPGALYMNQSAGPTQGIRGIISDNPYKFLVNVNGINVNIKAVYGARLELLNWELSDIDRIEVVRGPGSVTYGPGAIGGVINIFTKRAKQALGLQFGGHYWGKYDSIGNWVSYGRVKDDFELYTYFSIIHTTGTRPDAFYEDGTNSGYLGETLGLANNRSPATYMADYFDEPQVKAHLDIQINENWRFWARYANESAPYGFGAATKFPLYTLSGAYGDLRQTRFRYFQLVLENQSALSNAWNLKSTFGMSSIDVHNVERYATINYRRSAANGGNVYLYNDRDNMQNIGQIFSEWKYFTRFMLNYDPEDGKIKGALGFELSYDTIRPSWGKNKNNGLRLGTSAGYGIISGPSSEAYYETLPLNATSAQFNKVTSSSAEYFPVGNGWETFSHAFIGELNYQLTPKTTMILSARMDKHSYTTYAFSPRFALIYELKKDHYLKFIAQKSVRMNTSEELYMNHKQHKVNEPETLETFELIYSGKMTDHLSLETSVFFNRNEVISYDYTQKGSSPVGTLKTIGLEIDLKYKKENFELGINHSFVKQLSWVLASGVSASRISYSDYYLVDGAVIVRSNGNNLNKWSTHATKLYTNIDLAKKKLTLHGDVKVFWGFEGSKDGLNALSDGGVSAAVIDNVNAHHAFDTQVSANVSLTYHINKSADVTVFVQNIPVIGNNKRYGYSSGYEQNAPERTCWVEEPTVVGLRYNFKF